MSDAHRSRVKWGRVLRPTWLRAVCLTLLVQMGCANYAWIEFKSEPAGARVYDENTNEFIGVTPTQAYYIGTIPESAYESDIWVPDRTFVAYAAGYKKAVISPSLNLQGVTPGLGYAYTWPFWFRLQPEDGAIPSASLLETLLRTQAAIPVDAARTTPDVIESRIDGDFEGWDGDTIFMLTNGQVWQQVSYSYVYHYAYSPEVVIYKTSGGYMMKVEDVAETIQVRQLIKVTESRIAGEFEGWEWNRAFTLMNGQIWQQISGDYSCHYAYSPRVTVVRGQFGNRMIVEGMQDSVLVMRLK